MKKLLLNITVFTLLGVTIAKAQFTSTSSIGASQESWTSSGAWSHEAGFNPNEGYPRNDFDEDAETSAANGDYGEFIIIDDNDDIKIPNNVVIDLSNSNLTRMTLKSNSELHFGSNSKLILPSGAEIVFESGAQMIADNNSSGTYLEIGGNGVWGRECEPDCNNGTLTGPGTIDEDSDPNSPLPVDLLFFEVNEVNNQVRLTWATATEINNDFFTIEKSIDGINYQVVDIVEGSGNSNTTIRYEYLDKQPVYGKSYYRLSQTDFDGTSETFEPQSFYLSSFDNLHVSPNPVMAGSDLRIVTNAQDKEVVKVTIYASNGVTIVKGVDIINSIVSLPSTIQPGLYILKATSGNTQHVKRLLIK